MSVETLLSRLDAVNKAGPDSWVARCPAHDDRHPSLSISLGEDGRTLVKCWSGCAADAITAAVGLGLRDLFPLSDLTSKQRRDYAQQKSAAEVEAALYHELLVLIQIIGNRIASRDLKRDQKFRSQRPEWRPFPAEHWEREKHAARRIRRGIEVIYE